MLFGAHSSICKHAYIVPAMVEYTMPFVVIPYTANDIGKLFTL